MALSAAKGVSLLIYAFIFLALLQCCQGQARLFPGPYNEEQEEIQHCLDLTNSAGQACTIESDTLSLVYPRDSRELPTADQTVEAITKMRAAALPSSSCCDGMVPYIQAACPCLPGYKQILPIGGFDPAYFEGATNILALACRIPFPPCSARAPAPEPEASAVTAAGGAGPPAG